MGKWLDDKLTALLVVGGLMLLVLLALIAFELFGDQDDSAFEALSGVRYRGGTR